MGFFETLKHKSAAKKAGLTYEQYLEFLAIAAEKGYSLDDYRMHLKAVDCNMTDKQYREYVRDFSTLRPEEYLHFYKARSEGLSVKAYDVYLAEYQQFMSAVQYGDYLKVGERDMSIEEYIAYLKINPQSNAEALELHITTQKAQKLNMNVPQYREYTAKYSSSLDAEQYLMFCDARSIGLSLDQFLEYWRNYRDRYTLERFYQYCQAQKENLSLEQYDEWKKDYSSLSAARFRNLLEARKQNMTLEAYEELQNARQLGLTVEQYREKKMADSLGIRVVDLPFYRACKENQENGKDFAIVASGDEVKIANKLRIKKIILAAEMFKTVPCRLFEGCDAFQEIVLPWGIQEIGEYAFSNCSALECISIPGSIKTIPTGVFDGCIALRAIELHSGIESVNITGWTDLPSLKSVVSAPTIKDFIIQDTPERTYTYKDTSGYSFGLELSATTEEQKNAKTVIMEKGYSDIWVNAKLTDFVNAENIIIHCNYVDKVELENCPNVKVIIIDGCMKRYIDFYKNGKVKKVSTYTDEISIPENLQNLSFFIVKDCLEKISGGSYCPKLRWVHLPARTKQIEIAAPSITALCTSATETPASITTILRNPEQVLGRENVPLLLSCKIKRKKQLFYVTNKLPGEVCKADEIEIIGGSKTIPQGLFSSCQMKVLRLPETITVIGRNAFSECKNLETIYLQEAPKCVGENAFQGCSVKQVHGISTIDARRILGIYSIGLEDVTELDFAEVRNRIPSEYFSRTGATEIIIPKRIKKIESRAFADSRNLVKIVFLGAPDEIAPDAFEGCSAVETIDWGGCRHFGIAGKVGFPNVKKISFPEDTKTITLSSFANWGLDEIIIPESVAVIESRAFANCKNLKSIVFRGRPEQIAQDAFEGCTAVETIDWGDCRHFCIAGNTGFPNIKQFSIPDDVTEIPGSCFKNWGIQDITIPQTVVSIGEKAFEGCPISTINGEKGMLRLTDGCQTAADAFLSDSFQKVILDAEKPKQLVKVAIAVGATKIIVRDTIDINSLNQILAIPGIVSVSCLTTNTTVSSSTAELRKMPKTLRSLELPQCVSKLDFSIFNDCKALKTLTIPDSVEQFSSEENLKDLKLQKIIIPADMYNVTLKEWINQDTRVVLLGEAHPEKYEITAVGEDAHLPKLSKRDRLLIQKLIIPEQCTSIAESAFENLENLRSVEIGAPIQAIGASAFRGCRRLETITLPGAVISVDARAFEGCEQLESVEFPDQLRELGAFAFAGSGLKEAHIPDGIKRLQKGVFKGCTKLTTVTGMQNVGYVDEDVFAGSAVKDLVFSEEIFTINNAFRECKALERIFVPVNIAKFCVDLTECTSVRNLYLPQQIDEFSCETSYSNAITIHARRGSAWRQKVRVQEVDYIKNAEYDELIRIELEKAGLHRSTETEIQAPAKQTTKRQPAGQVSGTPHKRASWNTRSSVTASEAVFKAGPSTVDELLEKLQSNTDEQPYVIESVDCGLFTAPVATSVEKANIYVSEETRVITNNIFSITLKCREKMFPDMLCVALVDRNGSPVSDLKKVCSIQNSCEFIDVQLQLNTGTANGDYYLMAFSQEKSDSDILCADKCVVDVAFAVDMDFGF